MRLTCALLCPHNPPLHFAAAGCATREREGREEGQAGGGAGRWRNPDKSARASESGCGLGGSGRRRRGARAVPASTCHPPALPFRYKAPGVRTTLLLGSAEEKDGHACSHQKYLFRKFHVAHSKWKGCVNILSVIGAADPAAEKFNSIEKAHGVCMAAYGFESTMCVFALHRNSVRVLPLLGVWAMRVVRCVAACKRHWITARGSDRL